MDPMIKNQVWELVDLPPGCKPIRNKWFFKIKHKANGSTDKYIARLVAKCYTWRLGVDYDETFTSVMRFASIHPILALVAHLDLELF